MPLLFGLGFLLVFILGMDGLMAGNGRVALEIVDLKIENGIDTSYRGRHLDEPGFRSSLAALPMLREQALHAAMERTGLTLGPDDAGELVIAFRDTTRESDFAASSRLVRASVGTRSLVTLSARQVSLGVMDLKRVLTHEFCHCLMRHHMGELAYRRLPAWVREGVAVWAAGQVEERAHDLVAQAFMLRRSSEQVLANLAKERDPYLWYALSFDLLERQVGQAGLRDLIADLVAGRDLLETLEQYCGMPWADFLRARDAHARRWLAQVLEASGLDAFLAAEALADVGGRDGAIARLERLLRERPDAMLGPHAWHRLGHWRLEAGDLIGSARAFSEVIYRHGDRLGLQADSRLHLAECLLRLGRAYRLPVLLAPMLAEGRQPLDIRAKAHFLRGQALLKLGDAAGAARDLRWAAQNGRCLAPDALADLVQAHLLQGDRFMAGMARAELAMRSPYDTRIESLGRAVAEDQGLPPRDRKNFTTPP
ncbi:MAG: hypothetical protein JRF33_24135 [Deltaproteobacteria bacterium]|nr:hypothetical protein [Deltaproteobacteria bacterium]